MDMLEFVETNKGPMALRRHHYAKIHYFTQVWIRTQNGEWKPRHYYSKDRSDVSSGLLEALYQGAKALDLPYEDWW